MPITSPTTRDRCRRVTKIGLLLLGASCMACGNDEGSEALPRCVVPVGTSPTRGPADAWVSIVEFADFECSYCGAAELTIREVDERRPGLRWVFKHFPLTSSHAHALDAAVAAECAHAQGKFWEMHDSLFQHQASLGEAALVAYATEVGVELESWNACRAGSDAIARIQSDFTLGVNIGVGGTPTFFVNGAALPGAYPASDFIELIDEAESVAKRSGVAEAEYYASIESNGCEER